MPTIRKQREAKNREEDAVAFYIYQGWTPEQALGIVGNLLRESGLNPNASGDSGKAFGLAQWHPDRQAKAKQLYGDNWKTFENQLKFVDWELKNTEKVAGDKLRASKGAWQSGQVVSDFYERPKVKFTSDNTRQQHVADLAMRLRGIVVTPRKEEVSYANNVAPYINQSQGIIIPQISNFDITPQTATFTPQTEEKVTEESKSPQTDKNVQELQQKANERSFIEEMYAQNEVQPQEEEEPQQALPKTNFSDVYAQVSQFIDAPIAQQGGEIKKMMMQSFLESRDKKQEPIQVFRQPEVLPAFNKPGYKAPEPSIRVEDLRRINATTGKAINPNTDITSGNYEKDTIKNIVNASLKHKSDPYTALAIGLQETKLGKSDDNIGHIIGKQADQVTNASTEEEALVLALKDKLEYAKRLGIKNEEGALQAYNGLGRVFPQTEKGYHGFEMKKIYGVDVPKEGIDMRKNPLYGKRVVDLRDNVLRKNPELVNYITSLTFKPQENYFPQFQQGGTKVDPVMQFHLDYVNSPKYKERLTSSGYKNVPLEIEERVNNLKRTEISYSRPSAWEAISNLEFQPMAGSHFSDYKVNLDYKTDVPSLKKHYPDFQIPKQNEILAHELTHSQIYKPNVPATQSRLNEYDIRNLVGRGRKTQEINNHDRDPAENKADLDAYRYLLKKSGKYDAGKEEFNEGHLKIPIKSFAKDRLQRNYSDKSLIWLMNHVADSSEVSENNIAQQGGTITDNEKAFLEELKNIPISRDGMYKYPNQEVIIPSPHITMKNIPHKILGISLQTGEKKLMLPEKEYQFANTKNVLEIPKK